MKFSTETTIYTGSLGWYTGNSYWALRYYVTPGYPGTSVSSRLIYRKYRSDAQNYLNVEINYGASPAVDRFVPNFTGSEIFRLDSQSINFGCFLTSKSKKNIWGFTTGVFREEKPFAKEDYFLFGSFVVS